MGSDDVPKVDMEVALCLTSSDNVSSSVYIHIKPSTGRSSCGFFGAETFLGRSASSGDMNLVKIYHRTDAIDALPGRWRFASMPYQGGRHLP